MSRRVDLSDPRRPRGVFRRCPGCALRVIPAWEARCHACAAAVLPTLPTRRAAPPIPSAVPASSPHRSSSHRVTRRVALAPRSVPAEPSLPLVSEAERTTEAAPARPPRAGGTVLLAPAGPDEDVERAPGGACVRLVFDPDTASVTPSWQLVGTDANGVRLRLTLAWREDRWHLLDAHGAALPERAIAAFGLRVVTR